MILPRFAMRNEIMTIYVFLHISGQLNYYVGIFKFAKINMYHRQQSVVVRVSYLYKGRRVTDGRYWLKIKVVLKF